MTPDPPLPSRARFLRQQAEQEAEHGPIWTEDFNSLVRIKLLESMRFATNKFTELQDDVLAYVRANAHDNREVKDLFTLLSLSDGDSVEVWDSLDALSIVLEQREAAAELARITEKSRQVATVKNTARVARSGIDIFSGSVDLGWYRAEVFRDRANQILFEHRIAYKYVNGRLVERDHEELHAEVIEPLEKVLTGDPKFRRADTAYREALAHITSGQAGAAITSAGSALQEALRAMGAKGGDLNSLLGDATRKGFLSGHDEKLNHAYKNIADWVVADRGNNGNAHWASTASRDDAWLAVHVVGALIVRLAGEADRGTQK
jgi:hypothetical protein